MTKKEKEVLREAMGILSKEGYEGKYDGGEASIFFEAERAIQKALDNLRD